MASVSTGQNCPSDVLPLQKDNSNRIVKHPVQRRGRPKKFNQETIDRMVQILEESSGHNPSLSWEELGAAVGITGVHLQTVRNQLINEGYCKSVACQRKWLTQDTMDARVAFAIAHEDNWPWRSVLFSSFVSFSLGPSRKAKVAINDQQQERLCRECHRNRNRQRGQERPAIHCWAIVGFDHKSPLIFFSSLGDKRSLCDRVTCRKHKTTQAQQPQIQLLSSEKRFLLVDDANESNLRHNSNDTLIQTLGEGKTLSRIVIPPCSPDLNIAHDVLLFLKKMVQRRAGFRDEKDLQAGVLEEWSRVSVKEINKLVDSMPRRVEDVIRKKGKAV